MKVTVLVVATVDDRWISIHHSLTVPMFRLHSHINCPFYEVSQIDKIYGLDPSPELCEKAIGRAKECDMDIDFLINGAEEIKLKSESVDTVLITYTLCSIPNPADALKEIKRVMKSDAKILFCEHGIAPDTKVSKWQNRINPLWSKLFGGCNINRDIPEILLDSGFKIQNLENLGRRFQKHVLVFPCDPACH